MILKGISILNTGSIIRNPFEHLGLLM